MFQWILYDYYIREKEDDDVTDLICGLVNIKTESQKNLFKQNVLRKNQ